MKTLDELISTLKQAKEEHSKVEIARKNSSIRT